MDFKARIAPANTNQILQSKDHFIWCGSVVGDGNGKYHMFASGWEKTKGFRAWITDSKIYRAISDRPEGPFEIVEELTSLCEQEWSDHMVHNPTVLKLKDKYYLYYMGTTYSDEEKYITDIPWLHPARYNQRIGVAVADAPEGPWIPSTSNPILGPREGKWDSTFVTNPSIYIREDGRVHLIYKAKWHTDDRLILGLAVSDDPEGPYERAGPSPLFEYDVEDPFIWKESGRFWMVAKDMTGELAGFHNSVLFESPDAMNWQITENKLAWDRYIQWEGGVREYVKHVERPQMLVENGKVVCLYTAVGDYDERHNATYSYNLARRVDPSARTEI